MGARKRTLEQTARIEMILDERSVRWTIHIHIYMCVCVCSPTKGHRGNKLSFINVIGAELCYIGGHKAEVGSGGSRALQENHCSYT